MSGEEAREALSYRAGIHILERVGGGDNRWVERMLSLKETCRLQARSTYTVLVDAVTRFFHGQPPDLAWLH